VFGGIQKFDSAVAGFNAGSHQIIGGGKAFGIEFEGMGIGPKNCGIKICNTGGARPSPATQEAKIRQSPDF